MKPLFLIIGILLATFPLKAQKTTSTIHAKVKEYSEFTNKSLKTDDLTYDEINQMSRLADQINCLLTLEQAKLAIPYSVENKLRGRFCGDDNYPIEKEINQASFNLYKSCLDKLMARAKAKAQKQQSNK
jgi:hypothetical protein